jgi:probable HAF family extracellular repeat protein
MRRLDLLIAGLAVAVMSAAVPFSAGARQTEARWVIRDLGTFGGPASNAIAVNDRGQVIGWAERKQTDENGIHLGLSFLWDKGNLCPIGIYPADINDSGRIAGRMRAHGMQVAALWEKGRTRSLGSLEGERCRVTEAIALNDPGQVIGNCWTRSDDEHWRGFVWQRGRMTDLGDLGRPHTSVQAINELGQIVGHSDRMNERSGYRETHAFLWERGAMRDLAPLDLPSSWLPTFPLNDRGQVVGSVGGRPARRAAVWESGKIRTLVTFGRGCTAVDINEAGAVAGFCAVRPTNLAHPALWRNGKVTDLGTAFGDRGRAIALNDRGQVIGFTRGGRGSAEHAFVWESGTMTDLGTLGGKSSGVVAINERGQIIGWAETKNGIPHAVLWTLTRR